jgi:hypothetical protein
MSYDYNSEKQFVFTDAGQRCFLSVRDFAKKTLAVAGAVRADKLMGAASGAGNSWKMMACVDRLVELGELREVGDEGKGAWQCRVFVMRGGE